MIGQIISHYKIIDKLGEGGMGVVYKAQDLKLDRLVALKFLPQKSTPTEAEKTRFIHEAKAASALDHPNICNVHEIDETPDGQVFIAMAIYEGTPLNKKIEKGPLKVDDAVAVAIQAAEGLQAAHEKGIVHRDVKSSNIMVTDKGRAVIMDFGIAHSREMSKLTKTGSSLGTVPYMSPEQARGEKVDQRTDIWSLGVVLYEMIAGQMPFRSEYQQAVVYSILNESPQPLTAMRSGIPIALDAIVKKCLEKNANDRYQHADELIVDLRRVMSQTGTEVIVPKPILRGRKRMLIYGGAVAVLAVLLLLALPLFKGKNEQVISLAVLPLENLSGDPEQEYFADGITDALITELGQISALQVKSRTSVMQYKKTEKSLPQIAEELKADMVVEGSVLRAGEKVRITAKLIHPAEDRQLWVKSYDRDIGDFLALQSEIAQDITRQIGIRLREEERFRLAKRRTVNPQALDAYLKGVYSGDTGYFNQAIKLDPDFALAYTEIAKSHFYSGLLGDVPPREAFLAMKQAALKALEKDDTLGEAHGYLAVAWLQYDLDWTEAEKEFKRALDLNPSLAMIHHLYAHLLMAQDRTEESLAEVKLASALDPFANPNHLCSGWHCFSTADYDEAIELARKDILAGSDVSWAHVTLGMAYEQKSLIKEAIVEFQNAADNWKDNFLPLANLGHAYGIAGKKKEAQEILEKLLEEKSLEKSKRIYVSAYDIAAVYIGLGEKNQAFEWLSKALDERSGFLVYIKCDRRFDGLRSDPRFRDLLHRMNLPN
ncbi:MAG: protein kinase [Candidatus Aminicenantes bacterium]|nr:protein kinase [Candidatus Aminicenantes bacterium]